jgi:hypothetical protein
MEKHVDSIVKINDFRFYMKYSGTVISVICKRCVKFISPHERNQWKHISSYLMRLANFNNSKVSKLKIK